MYQRQLDQIAVKWTIGWNKNNDLVTVIVTGTIDSDGIITEDSIMTTCEKRHVTLLMVDRQMFPNMSIDGNCTIGMSCIIEKFIPFAFDQKNAKILLDIIKAKLI